MGAGNITERQVDLRSDADSTYATLKEFFDSVDAIANGLWDDVTVAIGYKNLDNAEVTDKDGILSLASGAITDISTTGNAALNGGLIATQAGASLPTVATITVSTDPLGNVINRVEVRDASTKDPILVPTGADQGALIFGLIHTTDGTTSGTAVGADASENICLSLAYVNSSGVITAMNTYSGAIEFAVAYAYAKRYSPKVRVAAAGGRQEEIGAASFERATFIVTTAFVNPEVIDVTDGSGSTAGVSTLSVEPSGEAITLPSDFDTNPNCLAELNGIRLIKGTQIVYASSTTLTVNMIMDVNDTLTVEVPKD